MRSKRSTAAPLLLLAYYDLESVRMPRKKYTWPYIRKVDTMKCGVFCDGDFGLIICLKVVLEVATQTRTLIPGAREILK